MTDNPNETFGQRCAKTIWELKAIAPAVTREQVAEIIDAELSMTHPDFALSPTTGKKERTGSNIPPTPQEVEAYSKKIGWPIDGAAFCDHYERKGWIVDRTRMKNWMAQIRKAKRDGFSYGGPRTSTLAPKRRFTDPDRAYKEF